MVVYGQNLLLSCFLLQVVKAMFQASCLTFPTIAKANFLFLNPRSIDQERRTEGIGDNLLGSSGTTDFHSTQLETSRSSSFGAQVR